MPFIWHDPTSPTHGQIDPGLASSIDIATTILARAGIQPYNGIQGRDLQSTAATRGRDHRRRQPTLHDRL